MFNRSKIYKSPDYWLEKIQNQIYREIEAFRERKKISRTELAFELNVTKGYISQVLNGSFNFTLKKLIDLCLHIGKVPIIKFVDLKDYKYSKNVIYKDTYQKLSKNNIAIDSELKSLWSKYSVIDNKKPVLKNHDYMTYKNAFTGFRVNNNC